MGSDQRIGQIGPEYDPYSTNTELDNLHKRVNESQIPVGSAIPYFGESAPAGFLICDGSTVSRKKYSGLFSVIGITCGKGDNSTTFNLPDMRGRFMRGVDGTAGVDPDKATRTAMNPGGNTGNRVSSIQDDAVGGHAHNYDFTNGGTGGSNDGMLTGSVGSTNGSGIIRQNGTNIGSETRPVNVNVNFIIKY